MIKSKVLVVDVRIIPKSLCQEFGRLLSIMFTNQVN